jgi:hypothetical protein
MEQTTARLRKTFHYPADNDSEDSLPEALDEEGLLFQPSTTHYITNKFTEQEHLIQTLQTQNANFNVIYTRILLALPIISIIPYLITIFSPPTTLLSLLSITSLLSTTFLLFTLPPSETGISFLDALNKPKAPLSRQERLQIQDSGPIRQYLPILNLGLCIVLGGLGMVVGRNLEGKRDELWLGFGWLPAGVYTVALVGKWVMGSVDPEAELGGLRYGYKGA